MNSSTISTTAGAAAGPARAARMAVHDPPMAAADDPGPAARRRLEGLYREHGEAVARYARRRTDAATADDVVGETFLVAWRRLADVPADPLPWLYGVARRVLANQRRAAGRQVALGDRLAADPAAARTATGAGGAADPAATAEHGDHALLRALATLRPIDREALLLTAWEGLEPARAARAAGCSTAAFHVRLHRARGRLAKALGHDSAPAAAPATAAAGSARATTPAGSTTPSSTTTCTERA